MGTAEPIDTEVRRTKAELREEAIRKMIDTAIRLIGEKGASALSIADVGRESGYSHSLPNYHFKTKKRLLLDVYAFIVREYQRLAKDRFTEGGRKTVRAGMDYLEATVRTYLALANSPGARAFQVLLAESVSSMPELLEEVRAANRRNLTGFEEHLQVAIERGEVDADVDPRGFAVMMMAQLRGAVAQKLLDPDYIDLDMVGDTFVRMLRIGLAPARPLETTP